MNPLARKLAACLLPATCLTALLAAPAPKTVEVVKDREGFIPQRKYQPRAGKVIGLLLADVVAKMGHEGRSSQADAMGFSSGGGSYNWVYVPVQAEPQIPNLNVRVGPQGTGVRVYPKLSMAAPKTVRQWDLAGDVLVEVEVNDGDGAPADEAFVGTKMRRLDGTREFPLAVPAALEKLRKAHAEWQREQEAKVEAGMQEAKTKAIKDRKPTGPREKNEIAYFTWLPESRRIRAHFRTQVTDGEYKTAPAPRPLPPGLPPPRLPPKPPRPGGPGLTAFPPPPPRELPPGRVGTSFGVEYGVAFEIDGAGEVSCKAVLPIETFDREDFQVPGPVDGLGLPPERRLRIR